MRSWLNRLLGWPRGPEARITCDPAVWLSGVEELRRRTRSGSRESGAFLLGPEIGERKRIAEFVFYDDIDPNSLDTGIVQFNGNRLPKLWEYCRSKGYGVVADVHVHPAGYGQSASDKADPVMPRAGHIAFILPHFARGQVHPGCIGQYEYLGDGHWVDRSRAGTRFFELRRKP